MSNSPAEVEFVRKVDHNEYDGYLRESDYKLIGASGAVTFLVLTLTKPTAVSPTRAYLYPMGLDLLVHSRTEQEYWERYPCQVLGVCWCRPETGDFVNQWTKRVVTPQATDEDIFAAMLEHYRRAFK